ncbi:hypothetical protein C8F01DRAFT_1253482 [Mycena amicta]|nr:hypothetical protein C8F01DRAFT_1253482 [Mycena amicta]
MLLPQELLDIIVDYILDDDLITLKSCSHSFRGLSTAARIRFLHTIRLTSSHNNTRSFLRFLESPRQPGALVHTLYLAEGQAPWIVQAARTLSLILPHLVNLRQFSLHAVIEWRKLSKYFRNAVQATAPQLETLFIRGIWLNIMDEIHEILAIFSASRKLKRMSLCFDLKHNGFAKKPLVFSPDWTPQLEVLAFADHYNTAPLAAALSASNADWSRLRTLSLANMDPSHVKSFLKDLPTPNVVGELNIWCPTPFFMLSPLGLALFPRLRALRITAGFTNLILQQLLDECIAAPVLQSLVCVPISDISGFPGRHIDFTANAIGSWARLCATLDADMVPDFELVIEHETDKRDLEKLLRILPNSNSRRLIRVGAVHRAFAPF